MNEIEDWYDRQYDEWSRLGRHKIEFEITKKYMDHYIAAPSLKILDIGGGPGRYSLHLTAKGHKVTLLDLSQHNIDIAKEKSKECGVTLDDYIKGNALELETIIDEEYDVVLLMGPLYHLTKEADRRKSVDEALRKLKKGGILFASFISCYAPLQEAFSYLEEDTEFEAESLLKYLKNGENKAEDGFTTAYFSGIEEAQSLMADYGLTQLAFAGVESILGSKERDIVGLPKEAYEKWIAIGYELSQDKNLYGNSMHFLYVGKK